MLFTTAVAVVGMASSVSATYLTYMPKCWKACAREAGLMCQWGDLGCICGAANRGVLANSNACACSSCGTTDFQSRLSADMREISFSCRMMGRPLNSDVVSRVSSAGECSSQQQEEYPPAPSSPPSPPSPPPAPPVVPIVPVVSAPAPPVVAPPIPTSFLNRLLEWGSPGDGAEAPYVFPSNGFATDGPIPTTTYPYETGTPIIIEYTDPVDEATPAPAPVLSASQSASISTPVAPTALIPAVSTPAKPIVSTSTPAPAVSVSAPSASAPAPVLASSAASDSALASPSASSPLKPASDDSSTLIAAPIPGKNASKSSAEAASASIGFGSVKTSASWSLTKAVDSDASAPSTVTVVGQTVVITPVPASEATASPSAKGEATSPASAPKAAKASSSAESAAYSGGSSKATKSSSAKPATYTGTGVTLGIKWPVTAMAFVAVLAFGFA